MFHLFEIIFCLIYAWPCNLCDGELPFTCRRCFETQMILIYALQWPNSIKFHICFLFGRDFLLYEQFF